MVSAVNHFVKEHTLALRVLAVNILGLAEVPITNGTVEASAWHQLTGNRQLVIYLTCTTTPTPFSHCYNQLEVIHACVKPIEILNPTQAQLILDSLASTPVSFSICVILNGPVIEGRRAHVGSNQCFQFTLTATQIGRLRLMGIGLLAARAHLDESIKERRHRIGI